jgi:GxxExxY protein
MLQHGELTARAIGLVFDVHKDVGQGLLESAYQDCMCIEFEDTGIPFQREAGIPCIYKGRIIGSGFVRIYWSQMRSFLRSKGLLR